MPPEAAAPERPSYNRPRRSGEDFERALSISGQTQYFRSSDPERITGMSQPGMKRQGSTVGSNLPGIAEGAVLSQQQGSQDDIRYKEQDIRGLPSSPRASVKTTSDSIRSAEHSTRSPRGMMGYGTDKDGRIFAHGSKGTSKGIEAELGPIDPKAQPSKRRSFFRNAGTASSPDLAHLVNKGIQSRQYERPHAIPEPTRPENGRLANSSKGNSATDTDTSEYLTSPLRLGPPLEANGSYEHRNSLRDRSTSHGLPARTPSSNASTVSRQTGASTILQASGTNSSNTGTISGRSMISSDDGTRSIKSRTRGIFGRFFNSNRDVPPLPSQFSQTSGRSAAKNVPNVQPPPLSVPPPSSRKNSNSATDTKIPIESARRGSALSSNDLPDHQPPLPAPIGIRSATPQTPPKHPGRTASRHTRQPATQAEDDEEDDNLDIDIPMADQQDNALQVSHEIAPDTTPMKMAQWKRDVEGMLKGDNIEENLAMELGVPVSSMTIHGTSDTDATSRPLPESPLLSPLSEANGQDPHPLGRVGSHGNSSRFTSSPAVPIRSTSITGPDVATLHTNLISPQEEVQSVRTARHSSLPSLFSQGAIPASREGDVADASGTEETSDKVSEGDAATLHGRFTPQPTMTSQILEQAGSTQHGQHASPSRTRITSIGTTPVSPGEPPSGSSSTEAELEAELEAEAKKIAISCYNEDETFLKKDRVAEYIGGTRPVHRLALQIYMQQFDFRNLRIDEAFRQLCHRLYLKAETQEIDRILEVFSQRYYDSNPKTIFGSPSVIHTVTGSFLLLNTDLHIADISEHMSRSQFVKLTIDTIMTNLNNEESRRDSTPDLIHNDSTNSLRTYRTTDANNGSTFHGSRLNTPTSNGRETPISETHKETLSGNGLLSPVNYKTPATLPRFGSTNSISSSLRRGGRWEAELELMLKEIYQAVKAHQILLPKAHDFTALGKSLPPGANRSNAGRAFSENSSSERMAAYKRGSIRGLQGLSPGHGFADGRASPTPSHATSIGEHVDRHFVSGPSLGFASNLTHTVIKEHEDEAASLADTASTDGTDDMSDDELALLGAPWAKEGNLQRKPYWDGPSKRSKEKNWREVFAVLQQGDMYMFSFGDSGSRALPKGAAMGGGNWMTSARGQGDMNLSHALASSLPPPGYNAQRPYCFSLTLANGEMSFFQAGTEELVQEWVLTCNYWAARRSRPPLPGGVSNVDYGWRALDNADEPEDRDDSQSMFSTRSAKSKMSLHPTLGRRNGNSERTHLSDWKAPQASLIPSSLDEESQLESLQKHIQSLVKDLDHHKSLEVPLGRYYPARSANLIKAKENWKHRSLYIHSEIVKYEVYTDALKSAISLRLAKQGQKKLERSLKRNVDFEEDEDDYNDHLYDANLRITPVDWRKA